MANVPLLKDFDKEASGILTSNFCGSHRWRVDCKMKAHKDRIAINPTATNEGMQFVAEATSSLFPDITLKGIFTERAMKKVTAVIGLPDNRKVTVTTDLKRGVATHQKLGKGWSITDTVSHKSFETHTSFKVSPACQLGVGVKVPFSSLALLWTNPFGAASPPTANLSSEKEVTSHNSNTTVSTASPAPPLASPTPAAPSTSSLISSISYELGARITHGKRVGTIALTDGLGRCTVSAYSPFVINGDRPLCVATEATFFPRSGRLPTLSAACETPCFFFAGNILKARLDESHRFSICYIMKQKGSTAAFTLSDKGKFGMNFSIEESSTSSSNSNSSSSSKLSSSDKSSSKKSVSSSSSSSKNAAVAGDTPVKL